MSALIDSHELAWAAGFVDGEGTFRARKNTYREKTYYYLQFCVTQKHPELIERSQKVLGGCIYHYPERASGHSSESKLMANSRDAFEIANRLWPWLGEQKKADFKRALRLVLESRQRVCAG